MTEPINLLQHWFQTHPKFKWLSYLPAIFWAGLIFWFSSQSFLPSLNTPWSEFLWKKTAHFLIFGGLYFWLWWGHRLNQTKFKNSVGWSLLWLTLVMAYAGSDELHQSFVANRHPSLRDIGIDTLGAISFALGLWQHQLWPKQLINFSSFLIPANKK